MKLDEIVSLIKIRDYIASSLNNSNINRKVLHELEASQLLIDKKIIAMMQGDDFKEYIDFDSAADVIAERRRLNSHVFDEANKRK